MTRTLLHTCQNCGDVIGNLETPATWQGSRVCALCYAKLCRAATIAPPSPPVPPPSAATRVPPAPPAAVPAARPTPPPAPPPPPPSITDEIDLNVLQKLTGQTEVRSLATARTLLETATKEYARAKSAASGARVQAALYGLRFGESRYGITPVIDAVLLASVPTILTALCLIYTFNPGFSLLAVILGAVHGAGIILFLGLFMDRRLENEGNRVETRRKEYQRYATILGVRRTSFKKASDELRRLEVLHRAIVTASEASWSDEAA